MLERIKAQEKAIAYLKKILNQKQLAHCYLFYGPPGVGKKTAAVAFAASVCCEAPVENVACGGCANCKRIISSNYPYIRHVVPEGSAIKIRQIRELRNFLKFKIEKHIHRFIIIDKAHTMTHEAANSLLKVLEDPPGRTCFILIADNIDKMLPTVISRSQVIGFNKVSQGVIEDILKGKGYSMERITAAVPLSHGSVGRALELVENENIIIQRKKIVSFLAGLPVSSGRILEFATEINSNFDISLCLDIILSCYRDLLLWKATGREAGATNVDFLTEVKGMPLSTQDIYRSVNYILDAQKAIADNANMQLVLETLLLHLNEQASKEGKYAESSWCQV